MVGFVHKGFGGRGTPSHALAQLKRKGNSQCISQHQSITALKQINSTQIKIWSKR